MLAKSRGTRSHRLILAGLLLLSAAMLASISTTNNGGYPGVGVVSAAGGGGNDLAAGNVKTRCNAQVTLSHSDPDVLSIYMDLNLLLCVDHTPAEPSPPGVFGKVRGNGSYTVGDSESTGGRLVVTSGHYTTTASDPSRVIVVEAKSGVLRGHTYNLSLSNIDGCAISGRWSLEGTGSLHGLSGTTNCTDAGCGVGEETE